MLDTIKCPPFESELKRATAQKTLTVAKHQIQTELGTSVAPRQRPKGNVSSQNLPLVLPSSPSPRNAIASPSPQVLQSNDPCGETGDKSSGIPQTTTPVSPYAVKSKAGVVVHNNTPTKSNVTANLFESTFVGNFNDSTTTSLPQTSSAIGSKCDLQSPTSPLHQSLLNAPKPMTAGHRRIASDTTAFNKYFQFVLITCILEISSTSSTNAISISIVELLQTKPMSSWHHMNQLTRVALIYRSVQFPSRIH